MGYKLPKYILLNVNELSRLSLWKSNNFKHWFKCEVLPPSPDAPVDYSLQKPGYMQRGRSRLLDCALAL